MRLTTKEIDALTAQELKAALIQNENRLSELFQLENKKVAYYNREIYELEMNIFNIKNKLNKEVSK